MQQLDALNQVAEFHRTFKHPIEPEPLIPSEARCRLRVALLEEEVAELKAAIAKGETAIPATNAFLGGDASVIWSAALVSLVCFALNAGLLKYLYDLEKK